MNQMTKKEFKASDDNGDIILTTKDSVKYEFKKGFYLVKSDTLLGSGIKTVNDEDSVFVGKLSLEDIINFDVEKVDAGKTTVYATSIVLSVGFILIVLSGVGLIIGIFNL